jgi:YD repeat-containing protein
MKDYTGSVNPLFDLQNNYGATDNNGTPRLVWIAGQAGNYVQAYGYDRLNRLNAVGENNTATGNSFDWSQTFDYDRYGNMWMTGVSGLQYQPLMPTTQSAINAANNRLVAQSYDAAGNQTSMGSSAVTYDAENRQVSYGGTVTYAYDGNGQRVSKTIAGGTTTVYAHDVFGNLAAEHVTGSGGATPPCVTCYLSWDHLGSSGIDADGDGCERDDSGAA